MNPPARKPTTTRQTAAFALAAPPLLALVVSTACRSAGDPLPFDAGAAMHAVREDAADVARRLDRGRLLDAVSPAYRLSTLRIAPGREAPTEFRALEADLRDAAARLVDALESGSLQEATRSFEAVLDRCDACHARYRPGS